MAIEYVLTCHSVARLSSIALLSTSGRNFKYRRRTAKVKLKKSATENSQLLTEAYGEDCMSRARGLNGTNDFRKTEKA